MDNRELEKKIGYNFKNKKLLTEALTHSSYANERQDGTRCNERLEFLGDSVLGFISAEHFFHHFKHLPEGELTKRRAYFVCEVTQRICAHSRHRRLSALRQGRSAHRRQGSPVYPRRCV